MEIELENGLKLKLNKDDHTSSIISSPKMNGHVIIPSFVIYQDEKYKIISIESYSFSNTKIESITFSDDCEITTFEDNSFYCAHIKKLQIPKSLKILKKLSLSCIYDLTEIEVSPKNKFFQYLDGKFLVGKSSEKNQKFDILFFARTDIKSATISPTIRKINNYSFFNHTQLESIVFPFNSKLKTIENNAFSFTSIKKLVLPETVEKIDSSNFCNVRNLVEIEVSTRNKVFSFINNQYLAKKSDLKNRFFDVIVFVRRDIEEFKVPKCIKRIGECAFQSCRKLKSIIFDSNSSLEVIEKEAFFEICGTEVLIIPASVKRIGDQAFSHIKNLKFVEVLGSDVELDFSPFCNCLNLDVISFPNANQITFNCDYSLEQIPEETEFHMRKNVTLAGKGLDEFQKRIQIIENETFQSKITKFKLKNENSKEKSENIKKINDDKLNDDENNKSSNDEEDNKKLNDDENNKSSNDDENIQNVKDDEYSSNYNYIDSSSVVNTNTEDSGNDKNSNSNKNETSNDYLDINENDENKKFQNLIDYVRHIEKRLSKYEKVEPYDFDSYKRKNQENSESSSSNHLKCSICHNLIENDMTFISGISYHKKCVTPQKQFQNHQINESNSLSLMKNYSNISPTKFLSTIKPQNNISENKRQLINLIDNELINSPYEIKVIDVKLISSNKLISEFNQNKMKISPQSSIEERFLYHGTSFQKIDKIKENGFQIQNDEIEKCICATDKLLNASLIANENIPLTSDKTVSLIFCKSFYNKTKVLEINESTCSENQNKKDILEDFGIQIMKNEKDINSKTFKFYCENQIIPIFSLTVKMPNYYILWKVSQIDEDVKTYKRTFLSILHVNFYCFQTYEKALEMIKFKKNNPIRLITNLGENLSGLKFIKEARKIIGSNFLCLVFDEKIENLNQFPIMENVLFTSSPQFFGKFSSLPMDENKHLNFIDDLQKHSNSHSFKINRKEILKFTPVEHQKFTNKK